MDFENTNHMDAYRSLQRQDTEHRKLIKKQYLEIKELSSKVIERGSEIARVKSVEVKDKNHNLMLRDKANMCLQTIEMMGKRETEWEKEYFNMIHDLVKTVNLIIK